MLDYSNNIILEYHENILCIRGGWLVENSIISKPNYDKLTRAGKLNVLRRACKGTPALIEYKSIPDRFKRVIVDILDDDPEKVTVKSHFESYIEADIEAASYFSSYLLPDGRHLPNDDSNNKQVEYYNNAIILNALKSVLNSRKAMRKALGGKTTGLWATVANVVNELDRKKYPHTLPANERRLKDRYDKYLKEGYYSLIHRGYCHDNARKVTASLERLILSIYARTNKPYSNWVHQDYLKFVAGSIEIVDMETGELYDREDFIDEQTGVPVMISEATCFNYINKPVNRAKVDSIRMNPHDFNNKHRPHHHRHAPNFSLSKISLDDRDLPRKMHNGNRVKAYYAYDVASGCIIGASYSVSKDADLFIDCIRDMFRFIDRRDWGMPLEVEVEHHLVNLFKDDLMKAGVVFPFVRWCAPSNSQEKHAEHFNRQKKYGYEKRYQDGIGRFYARLEANKTGGGRVYDEAKEKYVITEKTYSFEQLVADDRETIERYNNGVHPNKKLYPNKTRMEVLTENLNPNLAEINRASLLRYIGDCCKETTVRRNHYVQVKNCFYGFPDVSYIQRLTNYTVQAYYLPDENGVINEVYVYQNGDFVCKAAKIDRYNTSTAERTETDADIMEQQRAYIDNFNAMIKEGKQEIAKTKIIENTIDYSAIKAVEVEHADLPENPVNGFNPDYNNEYIELSAIDSL